MATFKRLRALKVKIVSLVLEAKYIRKQEDNVFKGWSKLKEEQQQGRNRLYWELKNHRTDDVRPEIRSSLLAYGFLRGREYERLETKAKTEPDWKRVISLVEKFGVNSELGQQGVELKAWLERAKGVLAKAA